MSKTTNEIAQLNDRFRLGIGRGRMPGVPGRVYRTSGIAGLPLAAQGAIALAVRHFSDFTSDNDPYGEHDFGSINLPGIEKVFWKIDYYADETMTYGSEDPSDPARCYRVLTIMLASEY